MTNPIVMVVEDNAVTQDTLKREFLSLGCDVLPMFSAESAWAALESGPRPHVIVLDFHLPGEDGPAFYRRLSMDDRFRALPVVPFTALLSDSSARAIGTVGDFIESRDTRDGHIHSIVSKGGREDIHAVPPALILAVAHALRHSPGGLPPPLRERMRRLADALVNDSGA